MNRRNVDKSLLDLATWPSVSTAEMPAALAWAIERRTTAMRLYVEGGSHQLIYEKTKLDRRRVLELFQRCIAIHPDGRPFGFRACRLYARVKPYTRVAPPADSRKRRITGHAGMLGAIFSRFPDILEALLAEVFQSRKHGFVESALRWDKLHARFLGLCREAGIPSNAYPFTVESQGERSLARRLKIELAARGTRRLVNISFGEDAARRLGNDNAAVRTGSRWRCLDRVEFDGHRIDVMMAIMVPDPTGGEPVCFVIERVWLLAVIDAASRAILGYHVSLNRNYTAEDVLLCLENALIPWQQRELTVPALHYPTGSGLPSGVIPELAYACWGELAIDNAKSNCSKWVWDRVRETIGCAINPGPVKTPDRRQFVERFFGVLEQNGFQRLPTTTGSKVGDMRRRDPETKAVKYQVQLDEMLDLLDVLIAQHNATPTSGLHGRSPLEYLRFALDQQSFFVRQVPEAERTSFSLAILRTSAVVRGNLAAGARPYVRFMGVRYYSQQLSNSPGMIGQRVALECRTRDLRELKLFTASGDEFGMVTVAQAWAAKPHDLRVRKAILRCIRVGKIKRRDAPDLVQAYIEHKSRESGQTKKARNELAHVLRLRSQPSSPALEIAAAPVPDTPRITRTSAPRVEVRIRALNF